MWLVHPVLGRLESNESDVSYRQRVTLGPDIEIDLLLDPFNDYCRAKNRRVFRPEQLP